LNRRGSAQDVILIGVLLFAFGIGFLVLHLISAQIYGGLLNNSEINSSAATVEVLRASQAQAGKLDLWFLAIFIGLILALIITSWYISANPLFLSLYVIVLIIAVVAAMILSNAWESASQRPVFVTSLNALPITNHVLSYLPYYIAVIGMLGCIVMFAKPGFRPGGDL
jgi:hypothetical protein